MAERPHTPIVSKEQFAAMAAARSAQEGKTDPSKLYGAAKQMYESMKASGPKSPKAHMEEVVGRRYQKLPKKVGALKRRAKRRRRKYA
jgi:hypothetical protein